MTICTLKAWVRTILCVHIWVEDFLDLVVASAAACTPRSTILCSEDRVGKAATIPQHPQALDTTLLARVVDRETTVVEVLGSPVEEALADRQIRSEGLGATTSYE